MFCNIVSISILKLKLQEFRAERPRFELGIPFWGIHAFQACLFSHSSIAPVVLEGFLFY